MFQIKERGFSTIELLSTLIIAAMFVAIFYQMFITADSVSTQSQRVAQANEITYRKLQQYENRNFDDIATPNGTNTAEIEDFANDFANVVLPTPVAAKVSSATITPTLKAVNVKTTFGQGSAEKIVEYTVYIQESGVGR